MLNCIAHIYIFFFFFALWAQSKAKILFIYLKKTCYTFSLPLPPAYSSWSFCSSIFLSGVQTQPCTDVCPVSHDEHFPYDLELFWGTFFSGSMASISSVNMSSKPCLVLLLSLLSAVLVALGHAFGWVFSLPVHDPGVLSMQKKLNIPKAGKVKV